ncbi:MAG: EamA family transporter [Rickettsiales bacterium]|nr:EamA family transporter [Rickettsiales bacterium]
MKLMDILAITLLVLIWGTAYTVTGYTMKFVPIMFLYAIRFSLAGLVALPFSKFPPKEDRMKIVSFGVVQGFIFVFIALAMKNIDSSLSSILVCLDAPITILMASIIFKEKINWNLIVGLIICFSAIYIISGGIREKSNIIYVFCLVISATLSATSNIVSKSIKNTNPTSITCYSSFFISATMLIFSLLFKENVLTTIVDIDLKAIILLLYLAVGPSMVAYQCLHFLLNRNMTTKIMPMNFFKPTVGVTSAYFVLGEPLNKEKIIGLIMIIIGVYLSECDFGKKKNKENRE